MWLSGLLWGSWAPSPLEASLGCVPSPSSVGRRCDVPSSGGCDSRRSCKLACLDVLNRGQLTLQPSSGTKCESGWGKEQQASLGALERVVVVDCEVQTESESSLVWGKEALLGLLLK